jgi:hypothetical protein
MKRMHKGEDYFVTISKSNYWHHNCDTKKIWGLQQPTSIHFIHCQWSATWFWWSMWTHALAMQGGDV